MEKQKEIGIYIHIPFCKRKCDYCDFISFSNKDEFIKEYIKALKQEIQKTNIETNKYIVNTIYIGGGTPSYIDSKYIIEIINKIKEKFYINKTVEITIEINPGTLTEEKVLDYKRAGINRISFGLQSTNNVLLKEIGRIHSFEEFLESYKIARKAGFKNINVDLMIGLPTQNMQDIEKDLNEIINLKPQHISVYSLILEEGTLLANKIQRKELYLPSDVLERKMYWKVKNELQKNGYTHYEISNFAKPNFESKHNLDCWNQKEYIGFGLASHSYINNTRYSNAEDLNEYFKRPESSKTIHEKQEKDNKMKEFMMLGLRKIDGVKISEFKNRFVNNPIYLYRESLSKLVVQQLIEVDDDNIKLTNKGIDLANLVWEEFI